MNDTKIEWCDSTWNPVTGCRHDCPYCYARGIANRFGGWTSSGQKMTFNPFGNPPELNVPMLLARKDGQNVIAPYPFGFEPTFHRYRLDEPAGKTRGRTIFVCSMADLFGKWVPASWILEVLDACLRAPQHRYLFLTKNPAMYAELDKLDLLPHRPNFWYGATVTNAEQMERTAEALGPLPKGVKTFFSIEPLMEDITTSSGWAYASNGRYANWLIIGAMTGPKSKGHQPKLELVQHIVDDAKAGNIPVFMKGSMTSIWDGDLITEFPWEDSGKARRIL